MRYLHFLVAWLLLVAATGCGGSTPAPPIYLGHVATTSGLNREVGEQETLGMRLAIEELAKDGNERLGRPVHVKHTDARGQLDAFEGQAVRLATVSRVAALYGGNNVDEVLRLDRSLDRSQVPLVSPLGWRPRGLSDLVFCIGMAPLQQGQALAQFAVEEKEVQRFGILVDERRADSQLLVEAFEREGRWALKEKYPKAEWKKPETIAFGKDAKFADLVKRLDTAKLQAVLFAGSAQDFQEFRKVLKAPSPLLFFAGPDGSLREAGRGRDGVYLASAFAVDKDQLKGQVFVQRFREAFKEEPDVHAALGYEGTKILVEAMRKAQVPAGDRFLADLRETKDFAGLTGPVSFGKDQVLRRPVFVGRLEGTAFSSLKRYEAPAPE